MADMIAATEGAPLLNKAEEKLIAWDDLPDWSKDNEYIHTGFRPISYSYCKCFQSCFYRHNETVNIYTHLLATFWMIALPIALYPHARDHYPTAGADDWTVFALFFLGGASCFALSTIYHVLSNHSHAVHDFAHKLDFLGITIVTTGCFPPGVWYTFPCAARKTKIFWISVRRGSPPRGRHNFWRLPENLTMVRQLDLVAQSLAAIFVVFVRRFRQPACRPLRGVLFSFMASSAFYPIIYACFLHGYIRMDREAAALRYALTVVVYLTAVTIYAVRRVFAAQRDQ